jgi:hypothetical protein
MKKLLIIAALLINSSAFAGCGFRSPDSYGDDYFYDRCIQDELARQRYQIEQQRRQLDELRDRTERALDPLYVPPMPELPTPYMPYIR